MLCDRALDVKVATAAFGRKVVFSSSDKSYAMTTWQGNDLIPLPFFSFDKTWEDDIVVSILEERLVTIDIMILDDGYHVRFITVSEEDRDIPYCRAATEQEAICLAALDFRKRFPLGSNVM